MDDYGQVDENGDIIETTKEQQKTLDTNHAKQVEDQERLMDAYINVFTSDDGERVLEHLSNLFYIHTTTMDERPDFIQFNEGQRYVVNFIIQQIKTIQNNLK